MVYLSSKNVAPPVVDYTTFRLRTLYDVPHFFSHPARGTVFGHRDAIQKTLCR